MNVQFAGTLQYRLQLSEVLLKVMEGQPEALSALLLTDEQNGRHGTICISQSRYVCGADLKNAEYERICTGYEALKVIAGLVSANFKYITAPPEFFENTELTLNIEIEKLLLCLPELPDSVSEFQDSDSLLDRVFSHDEVAIVNTPKPAEVAAPPPQTKKKSTWHSVPVSRAAEVFGKPLEDEYEEEEEPKKKYTTMEQRALAELGPPGAKKVRKKKSWLAKVVQRIGYFFYSLYTAPLHAIKKLAKPVLLPLLAIFLVYQAWAFLGPTLRGFKMPGTPAGKRASATAEHAARSTSVSHAPAVRRSSSGSSNYSSATNHPFNPVSNTITITKPVDTRPIVPYTTPENPPNYPHRRAFQVVPQAHPASNATAPQVPVPSPVSSAAEPPHSVPSTNSAEQ